MKLTGKYSKCDAQIFSKFCAHFGRRRDIERFMPPREYTKRGERVVIWLRIKQHKAQRIQAISVQRPKRAFQWNDDRDTLPIVQLP
ncbi:unnamed protein product [Bursaphelenchus xylophilus]|uniref:(pine wood nematode) hypothetical protein n=1 Tax=Bursaphelenchus xylophilus TaxID=6326 RepID=A0A7I8XPP6_BURXY|nr:unnamed protein product [Bursaphelenchus xylophilus]CAG9088423.1 unnamed protein product [Bursaphelenchus xylophilus]